MANRWCCSWHGNTAMQYAVNVQTGEVVVEVDAQTFDTVSHDQWGDHTKAKRVLAWCPEVSFIVSHYISNLQSSFTC
jgi:GDP-D-mannose dehydratase